MEKLEQLKSAYINQLEKMIDRWEEKGRAEKSSGNELEYTKTLIKVNIGGIYKKMFNVACKNLKDEIFIYQSYLDLLEKINTPWKEKLIKNKEFGIDEEVLKEETKLITSNEIILMFKDCHKKVFGVIHNE